MREIVCKRTIVTHRKQVKKSTNVIGVEDNDDQRDFNTQQATV